MTALKAVSVSVVSLRRRFKSSVPLLYKWFLAPCTVKVGADYSSQQMDITIETSESSKERSVVRREVASPSHLRGVSVLVTPTASPHKHYFQRSNLKRIQMNVSTKCVICHVYESSVSSLGGNLKVLCQFPPHVVCKIAILYRYHSRYLR